MGRGLDGFSFLGCGSEALAAVFKGRGATRSRQVSGGHGEGETPLPIPNRAVKPLSADGTWPARARESRTPPVFRAISGTSGRLWRRPRGCDVRSTIAPRCVLARGAQPYPR
jgi:hypothetical protein